MGLSMLVSLVSLEYGSMSGEKAPLALFLILRFINFWLLQTLNRIVVCGWTLCESHLFIRLYFDIFQPSEKSAFDHNLPLHTLDIFHNIFYIIYDSNQHTAWRPSLAIGFGSSTSSILRWRARPRRRWNLYLIYLISVRSQILFQCSLAIDWKFFSSWFLQFIQ